MTSSPIDRPAWTEPDPEQTHLDSLVADLAREDGPADVRGAWPDRLWQLLLDAGVTRWSLPVEFGGEPCSRPLLVQRYARLASGSLTAVFILSQHDAAVRRLLTATERPSATRWLEAIGRKEAFATVGISQLTTSRRLGTQALTATERSPGRYQLDGAMPWVTAAERADLFVTGALLEDGRQMLIALPADRPGVAVRPAFDLAALQASRTAEVTLKGVIIDHDDLLMGPTHEISSQPGAVGTAGLETSALALGQAFAAIEALADLAAKREELGEPVENFGATWQECWASLMACARGDHDAPPAAQIRSQANALVVKATQAYLTARRGTGFLLTEPAQRWSRQALFFLVWSCPSPIANATIRDLAGLCPA